jgi:hypothetical protein
MPRPVTLPALLIALLLPASALAEDAWTTQGADALRWPDAEKISLVLEAGDQVTVVYRADGMVRVRKGGEFGWVPEDTLTDADPTPATDDAAGAWDLPDMPSFDMPTLGSGPKLTPKLDAAPAAPAEPAPAPEAPASE